jgi:hypothetical protein
MERDRKISKLSSSGNRCTSGKSMNLEETNITLPINIQHRAEEPGATSRIKE